MPFPNPSNQTLKWLTAELVVVVLGVLIALAVSSWYEKYQDSVLEKEILEQFKTSLTNQKTEIELRIARYNDLESRIQSLLIHMDSGAPYTAELENYFSGVPAFVGFQLDMSAYELLKSRGLYLISNDALRTNIVNYYEIEYPATLYRAEISRETSSLQIIPFYNSHLAHQAGGGWKPNDYEELRSDVEFRNLAVGRLDRIQGFIVSGYDRSIELIDIILGQIENELN